ncbi:DUF1566 domain-containing protein [Pseudoalteromonas lipolytica]|jgi:hypothetical protein|uniref:DUF1566 domain-containing protein n=2 Tax=Pseudoalteromonas TaxID=53246 RepID=A0AAD0RXU1_9GAMM|nr:DUF1566 domain-containing protein [Pseudoalteromonas donghaensis]EWH06393.1 adhesin [Pseudoalteromonas lipolytica SCSIO 04301]MBE0351925.1 hypothetical protein [Pseudoalteromonas lipolytica LMEB 39]QLJ08876.1 DUF1566 domain-containing protein [Pseudoalteromonas sp. JSTW]QMW15109.1 DUF1566 domain-containing protein [Pseudoalteromonas sp. MT33b]QPL43480.1 DUF1566 domain-containing protein [Pseudoalteromonas sp. A41-2]SFT59608.1 Protein of unknown function [Pseudoalteromonas lipolytica]|tara:strand:- start:4782 stop:5303 length:522 start_codon:yes stop_codon:yes gene_type:complete
MRKLSFYASVALLATQPTFAMAQVCYDAVTQTTPDSRFVINENGTVSDVETGLMWQRCSFGQTYNSATATCEGTSQQLTWGEALRGAKNTRLAGFSDWHVPNVKELASILEHRCVQPSINESVFLATKLQNYWSSTSGKERTDLAWVYQFDKGINSLHAKESDVFLRLVRYEK